MKKNPTTFFVLKATQGHVELQFVASHLETRQMISTVQSVTCNILFGNPFLSQPVIQPVEALARSANIFFFPLHCYFPYLCLSTIARTYFLPFTLYRGQNQTETFIPSKLQSFIAVTKELNGY